MTTRYECVGGGLFLNNRHYDPTTGVFISVDPLFARTGEAYVYGGASPVVGSDPSGLEVCYVNTTICWGAGDPQPPRPGTGGGGGGGGGGSSSGGVGGVDRGAVSRAADAADAAANPGPFAGLDQGGPFRSALQDWITGRRQSSDERGRQLENVSWGDLDLEGTQGICLTGSECQFFVDLIEAGVFDESYQCSSGCSRLTFTVGGYDSENIVKLERGSSAAGWQAADAFAMLCGLAAECGGAAALYDVSTLGVDKGPDVFLTRTVNIRVTTWTGNNTAGFERSSPQLYAVAVVHGLDDRLVFPTVGSGFATGAAW